MDVQLDKYQALGNDFLVLFDGDVDDEFVRRACDRHRGVGADGLITATRAATNQADLTMVLRNSDGGRAEMSGNGIRCLVRAAVAHGPGQDELRFRVWERGAGETQACGTGSCAAAAAAHAWGLVGKNVTVHNPGGALDVEVGEETLLLTGPAEFVARVEIPS